LRWVLGNVYLRTIAACTATFNFFGSLLNAILIVYLVRSLEMSPSMIGLMFALANVGYLAGALTSNRVANKFGVGPTIIGGAVTGVAWLLIPLAPQTANGAFPYIVAASTITAYGVVIYNVTQLSMRQAITPERLQGRMNSVMRFIVWGVLPLGTLLGGAIATAIDLRTAIWAGAIGVSLAWLPLVIGPIWSLRDVPQQGDEPPEKLAQTEGEALLPGPLPQPEEQ
jgi:MFS family permease